MQYLEWPTNFVKRQLCHPLTICPLMLNFYIWLCKGNVQTLHKHFVKGKWPWMALSNICCKKQWHLYLRFCYHNFLEVGGLDIMKWGIRINGVQSAPRKILRPHPLPATCIHVYILILILHGKMLIRKFFHPILLLMLVILIIKPHSEQEREPPVSTLFKLKSQSYDMIIRKVLCSMIKQVLTCYIRKQYV